MFKFISDSMTMDVVLQVLYEHKIKFIQKNENTLEIFYSERSLQQLIFNEYNMRKRVIEEKL